MVADALAIATGKEAGRPVAKVAVAGGPGPAGGFVPTIFHGLDVIPASAATPTAMLIALIRKNRGTHPNPKSVATSLSRNLK